jgi:hypothetical protein
MSACLGQPVAHGPGVPGWHEHGLAAHGPLPGFHRVHRFRRLLRCRVPGQLRDTRGELAAFGPSGWDTLRLAHAHHPSYDGRMVRGPGGYGRYDDDPEYVGCPYAKSDMSPCIARDGFLALCGERGSGRRECAGCGHTPQWLIEQLGTEYEPAATVALPTLTVEERYGLDEADLWATVLTGLVYSATEPVANEPG